MSDVDINPQGEEPLLGAGLETLLERIDGGDIEWGSPEAKAILAKWMDGTGVEIDSPEELRDLIELQRDIDGIGLDALRRGDGEDPTWDDLVVPSGLAATVPFDSVPTSTRIRSIGDSRSRLLVAACLLSTSLIAALAVWRASQTPAFDALNPNRPAVLGERAKLDTELIADDQGDWHLTLSSLPEEFANDADAVLGEVLSRDQGTGWKTIFSGPLKPVPGARPVDAAFDSGSFDWEGPAPTGEGQRVRWRVWLERPGDDAPLLSSRWRYWE